MTVFAIATDGPDTPPPPERIAPGSPVWVEVRPNLRRSYVVANDILVALGKDRGLHGVGRNEREDLTLAAAWLAADNTTDLVITQSQRLHPLSIRTIQRLAEDARADLWLLHNPPRSDRFVATLERCASRRDIADVPRPQPASPVRIPPSRDFPEVPSDDFVTFLGRCREQLGESELQRVETTFGELLMRCRRALDANGVSTATVTDLLLGALNDAPVDDELTTRIRALQVAAWSHDLFIKVDLTKLLRSEDRPRLSPDEADARVACYSQPYRAVTIALARAGIGTAAISATRLGDASTDGTVVQSGAFRVVLSETAARAVRAQIALRLLGGSAGPDLLLPHTPKALAKALREAGVDAGVHVYGRRVERTRPDATTLLKRFGLTAATLP